MSVIIRGLFLAAFFLGQLPMAQAFEERAPFQLAALANESSSPPVKGDPGTRPKETERAPIVWKPRVAGAPGGRVGGAVRGSSDLATPLVLAPGNPGLTVQAAPSLFWHIDDAAPDGVKVFFTLIDEKGEIPLVETELEPPIQAGIQRIRLASYGVELRLGESYTWSIALVPDMDNRARDRVSQGFVERVADNGDVSQEARGLAAEGLWYDALELLADEVEANPGDPDALGRRRSLLTQAGVVIGAE